MNIKTANVSPEVRIAKTFSEVCKFNPFHDRIGRFSNKRGFSTYSANPKMRAAQPSINRSARAGYGYTRNIHRESKGENIGQNYLWLHGHSSPTPASTTHRQTTTTAPGSKQKQTQSVKPTKKPTKQPTKQNDTIQDKNVSQGKAANAVNGKDLSGKFQFDNNSTDYSIEQVIKAQGFDGKPTVTTDPKAFSNACKASNFIASRGVGASDKATLQQYDNDLKHGEFYVKCSGGSVHGYGMYAASCEVNVANSKSLMKDAQSTAKSYAYGGSAKKIYSMTLDKSAKIGTEYDLSNQMRKDTEFQKMCRKSNMKSTYTMDVGVYAAYKGYDAYVAYGGRSKNHSDYTVILNRSKVIIFESSN